MSLIAIAKQNAYPSYVLLDTGGGEARRLITLTDSEAEFLWAELGRHLGKAEHPDITKLRRANERMHRKLAKARRSK